MKSAKKAVAFMRSASQNQTRQHNSLVEQYETIEKYADVNNIKIQAVFDCVESNGSTHKKLTEALNYCKKNPEIKYLVVKSVDRLSRTIDDFYYWEAAFRKLGVRVRSATERFDNTPMSKLMCVMVSHFDSIARSERIKAGIRRKKELQAAQK